MYQIWLLATFGHNELALEWQGIIDNDKLIVDFINDVPVNAVN